ncbi:TUBB8 isoform 3, partial [Pan troglodytes]
KNMPSTPLAPTTGTATCSWSASTCTTTRPAVAGTCPALCSWIWSRAPWTLCARGPSGRSSGQTTSFPVSCGRGLGCGSLARAAQNPGTLQ